ncbi:MAG: thymidine phosphorylase [Nanoarchaeota archaeon]
MELKIRILKWSAGVPVAMLNEGTAEKLGVHLRDRISIKINSHELFTIVDTVGKLVKENEIAVSSEIKERLNLYQGQKVDVNLANYPESLNFIKDKLNGKRLSRKQIDAIIKDIADNSLSESEIALFVSGMYKNKMNFSETISLINAIVNSGSKLNFKSKLIADKHCIGGIPGNRTTPIIVSICASAGLTMPKNSSRAITSAAGTADVIEAIAKVEFTPIQIKKIVKKTNACIVWGGALELVPADSKIIQIEKQLKIDPEAQMIASIFAKKLAVNSNYILIDIPYGKFAKVSKENALKIKGKFEKIGKYFHKHVKAVLTKGDEPIGNGIGPIMELIDIVRVLDNKQESPRDLEEKSLFLSGQLLEMTGKAKKGQGYILAKEILCSGRAFEKFKDIIKAQEGKPEKLLRLKKSNYFKDIFSKKTGKIIEINNKKINSLALVAGCPVDKKAGLYLYHHLGEKILKSDKILTIYAESKSRIKEAIKFYKIEKPIKIS